MVSALAGAAIGLVAWYVYVSWENRPRRINYAFVVEEPSYVTILGQPVTGPMALWAVPLMMIGALLGVALNKYRRRT